MDDQKLREYLPKNKRHLIKLDDLIKHHQVGVEINNFRMNTIRALINFYEANQNNGSTNQCIATTARGTQCKYDAKYCEVHANNPQKG